MTIPVFKIEVYDSTPALRYTIYDAWNIRSTTRINDIGPFSFNIPARLPDNTQRYPNIALGDTVKIYYGTNGTLDTTNFFLGKIYQIHGSASDQGYIRTIKGKDMGEILQRRFKGMGDWDATGASTIVTELANDLSLGTGDIAADATAETHRIDIDKHKQYRQFLTEISDYWVNAGSQVKKDFFVDTDEDLVWKARPIRTVGVETLTVGDNINSYNVMKDLTQVKNSIHVYGVRGKPEDSTLDVPTDMADPIDETTVDVISNSGQKVLSVAATADFSAGDTVFIYFGTTRYEQNEVDTVQAGVSLTMVSNLANTYQVGDAVCKYPGWINLESNVTIGTDAVNYKVGSRSIELAAAAATTCRAGYMPTSGNYNLNYYPRINCYLRSDTEDPVYFNVWDSSGNDAFYELGSLKSDSRFHFFQAPCGRDNENGWIKTGSVDWSNIMFIEVGQFDGNSTLLVDSLYIDNRRYSNNATDPTSITAYGTHEMVVTDDNLQSDSDCEKRGEALLYQLKDPLTRIDLEIDGNTNVLIGDQLTLTIPAEGVSAASYDVISVTQELTDKLRTYIECVSTSNSRLAPSRTPTRFFAEKFREQSLIGGGLGLQK